MGQARLPVRKIREVLRLKAEGLGDRQIAASIGSVRSTVQECLRRCRETSGCLRRAAWFWMTCSVAGPISRAHRNVLSSDASMTATCLSGRWALRVERRPRSLALA